MKHIRRGDGEWDASWICSLSQVSGCTTSGQREMRVSEGIPLVVPTFPSAGRMSSGARMAGKTMGAGLLAFEKPEMQMWYAEAVSYDYRGYSSPGNHCYLFRPTDFPFLRHRPTGREKTA
jgi:hypothetical protein